MNIWAILPQDDKPFAYYLSYRSRLAPKYNTELSCKLNLSAEMPNEQPIKHGRPQQNQNQGI